MKLPDPVGWDPARRTVDGLPRRMVCRWGQLRSVDVVVDGVVPEPLLTGFVARDDRMPRAVRVRLGVLRRRRIATTDVSARGAAPEVEPPAIRGEALDAAGSARGNGRVDR